MLFVAMAVTVGMWFERFVIIVDLAAPDYLPSSWHTSTSRRWSTSASCSARSACSSRSSCFSRRVLPVIATSEVKAILRARNPAITGASMSSGNGRTFAVALGVFDSVQTLVDAIPGVRAKRLGRLEAYTPYPVHGIDGLLGLRKSPLGGMVLSPESSARRRLSSSSGG